MRKPILFSAAALLAGALAGGVQATPLSATGAMVATSGVADQAMPDQGVIKARWHHRHYGLRHHYSRRYAYRGSRNFQSQFDVDY